MKTSFAVIFVSLLLTFAAFSQDEEILRINSSLVVMNAFVTTENGNFAGNLKRESFKIFEEGVEQEITLFETENTPFACVIVLDTSGSMEQRVSVARSAAIAFLDKLRGEDAVAILSVDSKIAEVRDFSFTDELPEVFYSLKANGMTRMNDAIFQATEMLSKRAEKRKAILVLSDGVDTQSSKSKNDVLKAASAVGVSIYAVKITDLDKPSNTPINPALDELSSKTGGTSMNATKAFSAREYFARMAAELGRQYTLGYSPKNERKDGKWRSIELRINRPKLIIRTRKGYFAPKN